MHIPSLEDALNVRVLVLLLGLEGEINDLLFLGRHGPLLHLGDLELGGGVLVEGTSVPLLGGPG